MPTLKYFRKYVSKTKGNMINRASLINVLLGIDSKWSYALRALLIHSDERVINKAYLIQKIDYLLTKPNDIGHILDFRNFKIYKLLKKS